MRLSKGIGSGKKSLLALATLTILFTGCSKNHHYLSKKMLREQMSSQELLQTKPLSLIVSTSGHILGMNYAYDSDNQPRILCYDQDDQKVYVSVNQNTVLIITDKKGKIHRTNLNTIYLKNHVLYWLESVPMDAIERIEVYTETPKETPPR
jgi:hypothetical protein